MENLLHYAICMVNINFLFVYDYYKNIQNISTSFILIFIKISSKWGAQHKQSQVKQNNEYLTETFKVIKFLSLSIFCETNIQKQ